MNPFKAKKGTLLALLEGNWVLEYYTLILCWVLGSYYSYLYLKSIHFFSRLYLKGRGTSSILVKQGYKLSRRANPRQDPFLGTSKSYFMYLLAKSSDPPSRARRIRRLSVLGFTIWGTTPKHPVKHKH